MDFRPSNMMSWRAAEDRIRSLGAERVEGLHSRLCHEIRVEVEREFGPRAAKILSNLETSCFEEADGDPVLAFLLMALSVSEISAYALNAPMGAWHKIERFVWKWLGPSIFNRTKSLKEGRFFVVRNYSHDGLSDRLSGSPMFFRKADIDRLCGQGRPSAAAQARAASELFVEAEAKNERFLKAQFCAEFLRGLPGCSKADAVRMWQRCAPPEAKRQGRPKKKTSERND
ncbi:MAG TPA: hypothetical protein PLS93_13855 [Accumulibacter sp.]|nr:hypothetical protein [Hyphomonas sp.]HRI92718.1 hypothetical protein [Accumulibacter sp.]